MLYSFLFLNIRHRFVILISGMSQTIYLFHFYVEGSAFRSVKRYKPISQQMWPFFVVVVVIYLSPPPAHECHGQSW